MAVTTVNRLNEHVGQEVVLRGWLYTRRSKGKIHFLLLRDGTGITQCVVSKGDVSEELFVRCDHIPQESSLLITGTVREDSRAPGGYEILVNDLVVVHVSQEYPLGKKEHGPDFLLSHRHLWLRSKKQHAMIKIRSEFVRAVRDFFDTRDFTLVDAPIFTPAACEGTTTLFEVNYFDDKAYLTQSGQLYMEAAAMAFGRVYCFGPTFRAERSKTRKHLTEFWMVEPEVAFAELDDIMNLAEELVAFSVQRVLENRRAEMEILERNVSRLENIVPPFPRISYDDAAKIIQDAGVDFTRGEDFGTPHETAVSEHFDKPVLIHRFPSSIKAFYMKQDPEDPGLALCVDMIAPEGYGEIIGGGQREDCLELLEKRISAHNLPREPFEWYLDVRKYGSVPHGGFGLGIERTLAWICGAEHVRETIPFPRMLYRIYP